MRTSQKLKRGEMNFYQAELDSLHMGASEPLQPDQPKTEWSIVSLLSVVEEKEDPSNGRRRSLPNILSDVMRENALKLNLLRNPQSLSLLKGKNPLVSPLSFRVLIDFWSSDEESILRHNLDLGKSLLEISASETQLEFLACVYPSSLHRKFYSHFENIIEEEDNQNHTLSFAPRSDTLGKLFRSTTGLSSTLYSFLAV